MSASLRGNTVALSRNFSALSQLSVKKQASLRGTSSVKALPANSFLKFVAGGGARKVAAAKSHVRSTAAATTAAKADAALIRKFNKNAAMAKLARARDLKAAIRTRIAKIKLTASRKVEAASKGRVRTIMTSRSSLNKKKASTSFSPSKAEAETIRQFNKSAALAKLARSRDLKAAVQQRVAKIKLAAARKMKTQQATTPLVARAASAKGRVRNVTLSRKSTPAKHTTAAPPKKEATAAAPLAVTSVENSAPEAAVGGLVVTATSVTTPAITFTPSKGLTIQFQGDFSDFCRAANQMVVAKQAASATTVVEKLS